MKCFPMALLSLCLLEALSAETTKTTITAASINSKKPSPPSHEFPFPIHKMTLSNGLKVGVVPTGVPGLVSLYIPVSTGSRNEVEPGKSGFAHLFEHMMFRGTKNVSAKLWNETVRRTGAAQNAYTSDDLTCFFTTCASEDLETWIKLEADRFQNLEYSEDEFKDESRAVLAEYNKNSSDPFQKLQEAIHETAFTTHPYKHTAMGFLKDIEDMPNQFHYSREFFHRWYRPDNVTIILVGDVTPKSGFKLIENYFGSWKAAKKKVPPVPAEPAHYAPVATHVPWAIPTIPWVVVAFHTQAKFSTTNIEGPALRLAGNLLFGQQSEAYQRLIVKEQKVDRFFAFGGESRDPGLFLIAARVKKVDDMAMVRDEILNTCAKSLVVPFSRSKLEEAKTENRLEFAQSLASASRIASVVSRKACYQRDPEAIVKQLTLYEKVTTDDLARITKATFTDGHRVMVTLSHEALPDAMKAEFLGIDARAAKLRGPSTLPILEEPSTSPLVNLRLVFRSGSVDDPTGKEGLSNLTAAMVSNAGTRSKGLIEITKAYAATGSNLECTVDKEFTHFVLTTPELKSSEALELALEQLTEPGFKEDDFTRVKSQMINELQMGLKTNNDEDLGKLALEARIYPEPYAHPVLGTERALASITLDDVKIFANAHYNLENLQTGLGGGYTPEQKTQVLRRLAGLPRTGAVSAPQKPVALKPSTHVQIIAKNSRATAISFGFPIAVDRRHPDFAALWVASSYLGQHRNSTSHLYQRLREIRGLNYGDYAYIEAFPYGTFKLLPDPGVIRSLNHFQVWIRSVAPQNAAFALKCAIYELDQLVKQGMSEEEFESTRTFLAKFLVQLTDTGSRRLGNDLDMLELGFDKGYVETFKAQLNALSHSQVNAAIQRHLRATNLDVVVVTKDVEGFKKDLIAEACPIPIYQSPKPELKFEDAIISHLKLDLLPEDITVTPLKDVFN